jgi:hypothetical protein
MYLAANYHFYVGSSFFIGIKYPKSEKNIDYKITEMFIFLPRRNFLFLF